MVHEGIGLAMAVRLFQQADISRDKAARLVSIDRQNLMPDTELSAIVIGDEQKDFKS